MALSNTPMTDAFARTAPVDRRYNTLNRNMELYGIEKSKLDATTRVKDMETDIAERIAKRVHELDKAEIKSGKRPDMTNAFEDDEVTQFYVNELKDLVGDIGGMSRDMLKNQIKRMDNLMKGLADSSSEEKDFLMNQYTQSLTFLQNEYKKRSGLISRSFSKMGDLAEQYMDVRSMYAGFVDDNPIAMALFRIAGDAIGRYRENKKAQKELVANDIHRQLMAEKTEQDKHDLLVRETARSQELDKLREEQLKAEEKIVQEQAQSQKEISSAFSKESEIEGEAGAEFTKSSDRESDRLDSEFQREEIVRDTRLFEKVSDIHDLLLNGIKTTGGVNGEDEGGVTIVGGLGKLFGPILRFIPMLLKGGLLGLAGGAGWLLGSWINEKFIEGTELGDMIGETIYNAIEGMKSLWENLGNMFTSVGEWFDTLPELISETWTNSIDYIVTSFTDLGNMITGKVDALKDFFSIGQDTKDAIGEGVAKTLSFFGFDEAEKAIAAQERIAEEAKRNSATVGITTKYAPSELTAANDEFKKPEKQPEVAKPKLKKERKEVIISESSYVIKGDLYNMSKKNNLEVPVQKGAEQKINMINNGVSELEAEKQRATIAVVNAGNSQKSTKKSVVGTGGSQPTMPLTSARNPDSSIQRNTDRYSSRGMG